MAQFNNAVILDKDFPLNKKFSPPLSTTEFINESLNILSLSPYFGLFENTVLTIVFDQIDVSVASLSASISDISNSPSFVFVSKKNQFLKKIHSINLIWYCINTLKSRYETLPRSVKDSLCKCIDVSNNVLMCLWLSLFTI